MNAEERVSRTLAEKYRRQHARRVKVRADTLASTLQWLDEDQCRSCLRLMQEAADKTRDPQHRQECLEAMDTLRARLGDAA